MLPTQSRWNIFKCWVPNCPNSSHNPKQFVSLPNDPKMRETWLALTKKQWSDIHGQAYFCEDHFIPPFYKGNQPVDISLMKKPLYKMPERICRTCMGIIQSEQLFYVLSFQFPSEVPPNEYHLLSSHQREPLSQMLTFCIPELNLQTNPPSLVCYKCFYNIWMFFVFKIKCNENEKTLRGDLDLMEYGKLVLCRTCPQNYGVSLFNLTGESSMGNLLVKLFLNRYPPDIIPLRVCLKCWNVLYKLDFFYQKCLQIEMNLQHISMSGTLPVPYSAQNLIVAKPNYSDINVVDSVTSNSISLHNSFPSCSKTTEEVSSRELSSEIPSKRLRSYKDIPPPAYPSVNRANLQENRAESVIKCVVNYNKYNASEGSRTNAGKNKAKETPLVEKKTQLTQTLKRLSQLKKNSSDIKTVPAENDSSSNLVPPKKANSTKKPSDAQPALCKNNFFKEEYIMLAKIMLKHYKMLGVRGTRDEIPLKNWQDVMKEFVAEGGRNRDLTSIQTTWQMMIWKTLHQNSKPGPKSQLDQLILQCVNVSGSDKKNSAIETTTKATKSGIDNANEKKAESPMRRGPFTLREKTALAEVMLKVCRPLYENRTSDKSVTIAETVWQEITKEAIKKTGKTRLTSSFKNLWEKLTFRATQLSLGVESFFPIEPLDRLVLKCIQRKKTDVVQNPKKPSVEVPAKAKENVAKVTRAPMKQTSSKNNQGSGKTPKHHTQHKYPANTVRQPWTKTEKLELAVLIKKEYRLMEAEGTLSRSPWREIMQRISRKWSKNCTFDRLYAAWSTMKISAVTHEKNGEDLVDEEVWDLLQVHTAVQRSLSKNPILRSKINGEIPKDNVAATSTNTVQAKPTETVKKILPRNTDGRKFNAGRPRKPNSIIITENYKLEFFKAMKKEMLALEKNHSVPTIHLSLIIQNVAKTGFRESSSASTLYARWRQMKITALLHEKSGKLTILDDKILRLLRRIDNINHYKKEREKKEKVIPAKVIKEREVESESNSGSPDTRSPLGTTDEEEDVVEIVDKGEREPIEDADDNFDEIVDRMNEASNSGLKSEVEVKVEPEDVKANISQLNYDYISWEEVQKSFKKPIVVSEVIDLSSDDEEIDTNTPLEDLLSSPIKEKVEPKSEIIIIDNEEE